MTCIGEAHEWTLHVENGSASVSTAPCGDDCAYVYGGMPEDLYVEDLPVRVGVATDCPAYDHDEDGFVVHPARPMRGYESGSHYIVHGTRCDCNWWTVAVAASSVTA